MTCVACGGTRLNTRGAPCPICTRVGNPHVCARPIRPRTQELMEELMGLARMMAAANKPPPTEEELREQERQAKVAELMRLGKELGVLKSPDVV